jgi:hypothetical protein
MEEHQSLWMVHHTPCQPRLWWWPPRTRLNTRDITLPEAQLDRFMMRISLGYPAQADELTVLRNHRDHSPLDVLTSQ